MTLPLQTSTILQQRNRSLRLTFSYRGTEVQLTSQQAIDMIPPPSDRVDEYEGQSGFWCELRDADSRVIYRRVIHNPIRLDIEAPSGDPKRPFTHVKSSEAEGSFTLLMPDFEQARTLALWASSPEEPSQPAKEIAHVDLDQYPPIK